MASLSPEMKEQNRIFQAGKKEKLKNFPRVRTGTALQRFFPVRTQEKVLEIMLKTYKAIKSKIKECPQGREVYRRHIRHRYRGLTKKKCRNIWKLQKQFLSLQRQNESFDNAAECGE